MFTSLVLSVAMSTTLVPPNELVEDHSQPYHWTQPTVRRFEREAVDNDRRAAWEAYVRELDLLWQDYRAAGSNPRAWRTYNEQAAQAKRRYIYADPYLMPITP